MNAWNDRYGIFSIDILSRWCTNINPKGCYYIWTFTNPDILRIESWIQQYRQLFQSHCNIKVSTVAAVSTTLWSTLSTTMIISPPHRSPIDQQGRTTMGVSLTINVQSNQSIKNKRYSSTVFQYFNAWFLLIASSPSSSSFRYPNTTRTMVIKRKINQRGK